MAVNIVYASTFENLLTLSIEYLTPYSSEKLVIERILAVVDTFEKTVAENPESFHISPHLTSLGIANYREFTTKGFRILYRFDNHTNTITVLVFCSQKQDMSQILVDYCLIYK